MGERKRESRNCERVGRVTERASERERDNRAGTERKRERENGGGRGRERGCGENGRYWGVGVAEGQKLFTSKDIIAAMPTFLCVSFTDEAT